MKTTKLVIGILSIVLSVFVLFQGCTANVRDAIADDGVTAGMTGVVVAVFMLVAGIVAIATRKGKAGGIVAGVFYLLGGLLGRMEAGTYFGDLQIWSALCLIFAAVFILGSILFIRKPQEKHDE